MTHPGPQHAAGPRHRATPAAVPVRHARRARRMARVGAGLGVVALAALVVVTTVAVTSSVDADAAAQEAAREAAVARQAAASIQAPPALVSSPTPAIAPCDLPGVADALQAADDDAVIEAMGGGSAVREAVVAGNAPCIDLADPARTWLVVDKARAFDPLDYTPESTARVQKIRVFNAGILRTDAGAALTRLVAAAREDGAGEIAITSGFRSYDDQQTQYSSRVASGGRAAAEALSARPGYSEHQSGLAADVVACDGGCGSIEQFAASPQGEWMSENGWRYGFVVRYEKGQTDTTGFSPEPWHIRYIGVALATAYHEGGFHTLEEFWGLPAAPDYAD